MNDAHVGGDYGNSLLRYRIPSRSMAVHPKSRIIALRALLAVAWAEEQRLFTIINSNETSAEEVSKALNDLHKLWSQIVLQLVDIEDATATSALSHSPAKCNPEQIATLDHRQVGNIATSK